MEGDPTELSAGDPVWRFRAAVWLADAADPWHFVTLPDDVSDDIAARTATTRTGFGSVRVRVTLGTTTWQTSVFPDSKAGAYVLPLKRQVRDAEGVEVGDEPILTLELVG